MDLQALKNAFIEHYGEGEIIVFFAPGRVNLIGEHVDYNGGYVLPCALDCGTYLLLRRCKEKTLKFASANFDFSVNIPLAKSYQKQPQWNWVNYPLGVINEFLRRGERLVGLELLFAGDIPNGAGLSSSASVELAMAIALQDVLDTTIDKIGLVQLCQMAENNFVGVNCGIMDQFAVGFGQKNKALLLNCASLDWRAIPLELGDYKLVVINSNKQRQLADSKYNERRATCELALSLFNQIDQNKTYKHLCDLDWSSAFPLLQKSLQFSPTSIKRTRHVISENDRVLQAAAAIENQQLSDFGALMNASHDSLRTDYEVTGLHLDTLVEEARKIEAVLGARMTGAGFGGCTVNLVHRDSIAELRRQVGKNYTQKTALVADFYEFGIGQGARKLN